MRKKPAPLSVSAWTIAILLLTTGCTGAKVVEEPVVGSCTSSGDEWSCTTPLADAGRSLLSCPMSFDAGGACPIENTVSTTNPTQPMQVAVTECFDCASSGVGIDWSCGTNGWEAGAVFSCR
jgi:hypothetical protein